MRRAVSITLSDEEAQTLRQWERGRRTEVRLAVRAKIVLLASEGMENQAIAAALGIARGTVATWRDRFAESRLAGIVKDLPRGGRRPTQRDRLAKRIIKATTQEKPPGGITHWSTRTLAKHLGCSPSMVQRVWKAHGLKPHLVKTFKVSNDPRFVEKMVDVVGLYLCPPDNAIVLSVDEKSQIQALDRTQPSLPIYPGRCGTMTHDYKRNGTTTLFAALDVAGGIVIADCMPRHRHQEFIKFLRRVDESTDPDLDVHLIVDNYATHKHEKVQRWLARHRRFHMHFTPTSSSWLNLVERWFRELTDKRIRRGAFKSVQQLIDAIMEYIEHHNDHTTGYRWRATAEQILAKYRRAKQTLDKIKTE